MWGGGDTNLCLCLGLVFNAQGPHFVEVAVFLDSLSVFPGAVATEGFKIQCSKQLSEQILMSRTAERLAHIIAGMKATEQGRLLASAVLVETMA